MLNCYLDKFIPIMETLVPNENLEQKVLLIYFPLLQSISTLAQPVMFIVDSFIIIIVVKFCFIYVAHATRVFIMDTLKLTAISELSVHSDG